MLIILSNYSLIIRDTEIVSHASPGMKEVICECRNGE